MNAALNMRRLEVQDELQLLRDRLDVAREQRDKWKAKNPDEFEHWDTRVQDLELEIKTRGSILRTVLVGDGGPDEQRRLEAKEDWKRERDEYA